MDAPLKSKFGQPSWRLKNRNVEAWITRTGGMLAPATFRLPDGRKVQPFAIAPWAHEKLSADTPPLLQALRGDFFCAPFGGNGTSWRGEKHPPHGEPANANWALVAATREHDASSLHLRLVTQVRRGTIDKRLTLQPGHSAIYCEHTLIGFRGPMSIGTHPCLRVPGPEGSARVSAGGWEWGQVLPVPFENPAAGGYSALRSGAKFRSLSSVPRANGGNADLSRYPAREGFEDLVMLMGKSGRSLGWSAVTFPRERWVFLQLKNPEVLRHTVLWHSNGGRHYAPWNGRHRGVLGLEETTSYFHLGLAESARSNAVNRAGYPTSVKLSPKKPLRVAHIFAVAAIPRGFDIVADVRAAPGGIAITSASGRSTAIPLDVEFLSERD
ncbi:MAG TPA: hypothetical protein VHO24_03080 [Opitutaceae bacterium]|nr:hypothetical protein [Opitutaceae bacterium]